MANEPDTYINQARKDGLSDEEIRKKLVTNGWSPEVVDGAMRGTSLEVPAPPAHQLHGVDKAGSNQSHEPISVVQNLSIRGFEYKIMFTALLASAFSIGFLAHHFIEQQFSKISSSYVYGGADSSASFAVTSLLVFFPIFAFLFLRLKKAELINPQLRLDASRRKLSQLAQFLAFIFGIGNVVIFVYALVTPNRYGDNPSMVTQFLHVLVTLTITGSIFIYYWHDDHKKETTNERS